MDLVQLKRAQQFLEDEAAKDNPKPSPSEVVLPLPSPDKSTKGKTVVIPAPPKPIIDFASEEMMSHSNYEDKMKQLMDENCALLTQKDIHLVVGKWQTSLPETPLHPYSFIFWDPWYDEKGQPSASEFDLARSVIDEVSKEGTVLFVMCAFDQFGKWMEIFSDTRATAEGMKWWHEKHLFTIIRDKNRCRGFQNSASSRPVTEHGLFFVCRQKASAQKHAKIRAFRHAANLEGIKWSHHRDRHEAAFNTYTHYEPPLKSQRLKDDQGNLVRQNAEKGMELMEWLLLLHTMPGESVLDVQAGTGVLAMACLKHGRKYYGIEEDGTVAHAALARLAKYEGHMEKNLIDTTVAGLSVNMARSVTGGLYHLPPNNLPLTVIHKDPNKNFGSFVSEDFKQYPWYEQKTCTADFFEIKTSKTITKKNIPLGKGVFLKSTSSPLPVHTPLPIFMWGNFIFLDNMNTLPAEQLLSPGVYALTKPYNHMCLVIDNRCPAGKINDARGTKFTNNIVFRQSQEVRALFYSNAPMPQTFIQAYTIADIEPEDELFMDYGEQWWKLYESTKKGQVLHSIQKQTSNFFCKNRNWIEIFHLGMMMISYLRKKLQRRSPKKICVQI